MATYTENYSLVKPGYGDQADIDVLNRLMTDKVDDLLFENRRISADEYDQEESYAVGDYAIYENVLYKCLEDTSGNFDPSKWEMTNLAKELATKGEGGADVTKTASGNPIEITDGAAAPLVKCVTEIQGSQDLHGYDKPWVGGAGKNKFEPIASYSSSDISFVRNSDYSVTFTGNSNGTTRTPTIGTVTLPAGNYIASGVSGGSNSTFGMRLSSASLSNITWYDGEQAFTLSQQETVTFIARFSNVQTTDYNVTMYPMIRLSTETDSTFAPYSNICPITAYTEGEIEVRGKNICGPLIEGYVLVYNTGLPTANANYAITDFIAVKKDTAYTISNCSTGSENWFYDINKTPKSVIPKVPSNTIRTYIPTEDGYIRCSLSISSVNIFQLEEGSTATTYEPYTSTTHTTTYPSAIYRGSEDVVNGTETHDMVKVVFDGSSDEDWRINNTYPSQFAIDASSYGIKLYDSVAYAEFAISNMYVKNDIGASQRNNGEMTIYNGTWQGTFGIWVAVKDERFTTLEDFKAAIATTPIEFAYKMQNPTTSSVTPTNLPIRTLSGYTHIESSTGEMEIEYITEEFQPIVDLIQSNKHVYSTAEQIVGTWIDGSVVYEKTIVVDSGFSASMTISHGISNISDIIAVQGTVKQNNGYWQPLNDNAASNYGIRVGDYTDSTFSAVIEGGRLSTVSEIRVTIQYTKTTPTRSLNLTKSAVDEIPDEIKNAPFEEKPDYNEADDDAPTEVDER